MATSWTNPVCLSLQRALVPLIPLQLLTTCLVTNKNNSTNFNNNNNSPNRTSNTSRRCTRELTTRTNRNPSTRTTQLHKVGMEVQATQERVPSLEPYLSRPITLDHPLCVLGSILNLTSIESEHPIHSSMGVEGISTRPMTRSHRSWRTFWKQSKITTIILSWLQRMHQSLLPLIMRCSR